MENKPYYALFADAENDPRLKMKFLTLRLLKIDQHKIEQGNNVITILPSREGLGRKCSYVFTEKIEDLEDTCNFAPTEPQELSQRAYLSLVAISKETTPYAALEKLYSYTTTHTDNRYATYVQEALKDTNKYLRQTLKQLFYDDDINGVFIDVCLSTRLFTAYTKQVGSTQFGATTTQLRY